MVLKTWRCYIILFFIYICRRSNIVQEVRGLNTKIQL